MSTQSKVEWLSKYLRLANYLGAAQLYLRDNFLLEEELKPEHIKRRVLGHWGTVPGLNFIWATLDTLIKETNQKMLLVVGPGHGYPAIQANLFLEGSIGEFYTNYNLYSNDPLDRKAAFHRIIRDFSWPGGFPSHSNPTTPGCILEGGELGYSLATSFGAAMDNPDLIVACVVGDGEAETGPTATAWHSNKFLNPITSGAVLPIIHINGYKISGPTIYGTMSNDELINLFNGYGYDPIIIDGEYLFEPMLAAVNASYAKIKEIQEKARKSGIPGQPKWPMICLRSPKGWFGPGPIKEGKPIIGSFRSHGIPLEHTQTDEKEFSLLKEWLESYKIQELLNSDYSIKEELKEFLPTGTLRLGMNGESRALGTKNLILPNVRDYETKIEKKGEIDESSTEVLAKYMKDIFVLNDKEKNFRVFCPDETESNKLGTLFQATKRGYLWPVASHDDNISPDGRVMEMLSEHTLMAWQEGYTLTGRYGMFITYEAFAEIVSSMIDQYSKFIRHADKVKWRNPVPALNILLTSLCWRQDHNGFSHQNPGFVSSVLNNHAEFVDVYFPTDANSMLLVAEDCFKKKNCINVIVAGKRPISQWLSLDEARTQMAEDIHVWDFLSDPDPDVVLTGCGDYATRELIAARQILKRYIPEIKLRLVNIVQINSFGIGDNKKESRINHARFDEVFTTNRPIIFNYHGYEEDIKSLIFNHHAAPRFSIHGYAESGTTTTPFDMLVRNKVDRYHIAIEALQFAAINNYEVKLKADTVEQELGAILDKHEKFIKENGFDIPEVENFKFEL